jgi:WD40 repeat protein
VILNLTFSPDGSVLFIGADEADDIAEEDSIGSARFWGVESQEELGRYFFPIANAKVVFSEGGTRAAIRRGATVKLWERTEGRYAQVDEFAVPSLNTGIIFAPKGKNVFTGGTDGKVYVWAFQSQEAVIQQPMDNSHHCFRFTFNPNGETLFAACWLYGVKIWDVDSGECIQHHEQVIEYPEDSHDEEPSAVAYSPDGLRMASGYAGGGVVLWNADPLTPVGDPLQGNGGVIQDLAFSPDGSWLAAGSLGYKGSPLVVWRTEDGEKKLALGEEGDLFGQGEWITFDSLAFSSHEDRLVVVGSYLIEGSKTRGLWFIEGIQSYLAEQSESFTVEKVHEDMAIEHLTVHPDGTVLGAVFGEDDKIHFYDVETMEEISNLYHGNEYFFDNLALDPKGLFMASGGPPTISDIRSDTGDVIQLWDLISKKPIKPRLPSDDDNIVYDMAFSPDGTKLATYSSGNSDLVLWDVTLETWRTYACRMANRDLTEEEWSTYLGDRPYRQTCGPSPGSTP